MQVNFHTTLNGDSIISLIYHKVLEAEWTEAAKALRPVLAAAAPSAQGHLPHIIGRSRGQKVCLDQDFVVEKLTVSGKQYIYRQYEVRRGVWEGVFHTPLIVTYLQLLTASIINLARSQGSFSQPNAGVCEKMLEWAVDVTKGSEDHDLLELYCGNGNFTIPLSQNFRRVVATEVP